MDSGNFFAASGPKPEYKQHQFGGSLGGRIIADKSFFFADYAGLRLRQGNTYTSTIPTLSMRRGDFSGLAPIFDPQTGAQFPNNQIPANRMDPAAIALTRLYPAPTNSALANNFVYSPTKTQDDDSFDVRIDHRFDPNNLLFARYSYNNTTTVLPDSLPPVDGITPGGLGNTIFPGSSRQKPQAAQVNFDHVFSPGLVLEAKSGEFFFHLKAANGEIIGRSETYVTKSNAERARDSIIETVPPTGTRRRRGFHSLATPVSFR